MNNLAYRERDSKAAKQRTITHSMPRSRTECPKTPTHAQNGSLAFAASFILTAECRETCAPAGRRNIRSVGSARWRLKLADHRRARSQRRPAVGPVLIERGRLRLPLYIVIWKGKLAATRPRRLCSLQSQAVASSHSLRPSRLGHVVAALSVER